MVEGYKNTEVGIIPNDWNLSPIGTYARLINGRAYAIHEWENQGVPVIRLQNLTGSGSVYYYSNLKLPERQYCHYDDLLFMWSATFGPIIWKGEKAIYHYHIWKVETDDEYLDKWYLYHVLNELTERVKQNSTNGGTMLHLTKGSMIQMQIPLPPTKAEQTAIATTLNDADALITQLEKLIAKKKAMKQGAMQELLKPKEGWETKTLGEVVNIRKGQLITDSARIDGNIPVIAGGKTPAYFHCKANRYGKTITISGSGASAGYVSFHSYPIFASDCSTIEESENYSIEYVFYFLQLMQEKIYKMQTGGAQPHIHPKDINPKQIPIPNREEQIKVAKILSDMDNEILILEGKLEKQKQLKQGMMQNLLTGKIRLV